MEGSKWYGLTLLKKTEKVEMRKRSIFVSDDSDDDSKRNKKVKQKPIQKSKEKSAAKKTEDIDPAIYEYDSIYDEMKAKEAPSVAQPKSKEPRYIGHLLKAAEKRKKDNERRVEKKIQEERIKEGDEFADKESFVTSAYHKKMLEMEEQQQEEERERKLEEMMDITKQNDLSGFYRHFLRQTVGEEKVPDFGARNSKMSEVKSDTSTASLAHCEKLPGSKTGTHKSGKSKIYDDKLPELNKECSPDLPVCTKPKNLDSDEKYSSSSSSSDSEGESISMRKKTDGKDGENLKKNRTSFKTPDSKSDVNSNSSKTKSETSDNKGDGNSKSNKTNSETSVSKGDGNMQNNMVKFEKRTVGKVFEEAQARYFKRRDASKSK